VSRGPRALLSVVVPVYDEEANIVPFYRALTSAASEWDVEIEILFVDDGSQDRSFEHIAELHRSDPRVKALRFSRNFGSHPALSAGLRHAHGDAGPSSSASISRILPLSSGPSSNTGGRATTSCGASARLATTPG